MSETFRSLLKRTTREGQETQRDIAQMLLDCLAAVDAIDDPDLKLRRLDELWGEYEYLYARGEYRRRYTWLLGPVLGVPFDDHIDRQVLLGLAVEVGDRGWGISLMFGMPWAWQDELMPQGFWFGIGFSGEPAANVVNGVSGASHWAAKL